MHNNYYFLRQLSVQLEQLMGWVLATCFSQDKDELVLGFIPDTGQQEEFYIRAVLTPQFCCLHFPDTFNRARKNSVDLFTEMVGKKVTRIKQFVNERSFALYFEGSEKVSEYALLFKMHGNRSNLVLFADEAVTGLFKNKLAKDNELKLSGLDRPIQQDYAHFLEVKGNYKALFPTFGPVLRRYLSQQNYEALPIEEKWQLLEKLKHQLEQPEAFYTILLDDKPVLSLMKIGEVIHEEKEPIRAINHFFRTYVKEVSVESEKQQTVRKLEKTKARSENYIQKTTEKLHAIEEGIKYNEMADVIMANLHQIPPGADKVDLFNFYTNENITIKLKKNLSPQKNAENYYRKAKNQQREIAQLRKNVEGKQAQLKDIEQHLMNLQELEDVKAVRQYLKEQGLEDEITEQPVAVPYRHFTVDGFEVLVGKTAASNDVLLRDYAWKEDLWLHAKDVPGSHVVIKHQAGKQFPEAVIEKAAQLAAYYSKRKNDTLCPVIVTPRKYVRKSKGMLPGQVIVDREEVVMVTPGLAGN